MAAKKTKQAEQPAEHDIPENPGKGRKMRRIELIFSQAMEEDFIQSFHLKQIKNYTEFPEVRGTGYSTPKLGSDIWPQLNAMMILYCTDEETETVKAIVTDLRRRYVGEGIACYISKAREW